MSYFKKNNTWYCANDRSITRIETQNLPTQPYINIYKEVDSVSLSTVEPLNVEDIELQENINKEQNEIFNRNVISVGVLTIRLFSAHQFHFWMSDFADFVSQHYHFNSSMLLYLWID